MHSKGINHIYESKKWAAVHQIILVFVEEDPQTRGIEWLLVFYSNMQDLADYTDFLETDYAFCFYWCLVCNICLSLADATVGDIKKDA